MPKADAPVSRFEFWPSWIMYTPVALLWLALALRYRSLTLPLISNPRITMAGMVGGSKNQVMSQAHEPLKSVILPWLYYQKTSASLRTQVRHIEAEIALKNLDYPFVCKPDTGCRGAGVRLIRSRRQLIDTLSYYPKKAGIVIQQLSQYEPEVGIFYVRQPNSDTGQIVSLTQKHTPSVIGDGTSTLEQLASQDPRASLLLHLYETRNQQRWQQVIPAGEHISLLFSASHCRGAVFEDARDWVTPALTNEIDYLMKALPDFCYGRLDVKYKDLESLQQGRHIGIVEINGASSESIHIWDKRTRLSDAISTLLWQYRTLFQIGNQQRQRGFSTPGITALIRHWRYERDLTRHYPETD